MPRPRSSTPSLCHHKSSSRGYVLHQGRKVYLGKWPSDKPKPPPSILSAYGQFLESLKQSVLQSTDIDRPQAAPVITAKKGLHELTVVHLVEMYLQWADQYFGPQAQEVQNSENMLTELVMVAGDVLVKDFTPRDLHRVRDQMVRRGRTRQGCNKCVQYVRRLFKWGVEYGHAPHGVLVGLQCVRPLMPGKTEAPESKKLGLVPDDVIEATLPHLPRAVAAMVRICRLTGCRPSEACRMRTQDIDQEDPTCWVYSPETHKTALRGRVRSIAIGPKAIEILRPWLRPEEPGAFLFSPAREREHVFDVKRKQRKTKVQPSQIDRSKPLAKTVPGEVYDTKVLAHAIRRAADKAGVERWSPGRLRKTAAQEFLRAAGLEGARAALGHRNADVTVGHYLSFEKELAKRAVIQVG